MKVEAIRYKRRCFACKPWIAACYIRNHGERPKVGQLEIMGSPCHLYSDLEFNIKENAEKNGDKMVDLLILIAFEALFDKYSIEGDTNSVVELGSSTNDKFSRHLIIRGYQGLLSKTTHILVHLLMRYVRGYTMEEEGIKDLKVQTALKGSGGSKTGASECIEASIIYVRFKAAASELKPVLEEIERRSSRKEYVQILSECHRIYCEQRLSLVCQLHQQFDHFFPSTSEDISSLAPLVDPLCTFLYDTLRPKLIHETNLDGLCELVDILKIEVIGEHLSRRSESLAGIRPTLDRILADIHERLTFRARTHIRDEIANYSHWMKIWITLESWNNRLRPTQIPLLLTEQDYEAKLTDVNPVLIS
ncbi:hypothetical protein LXL04_028889 [Taraxacum kok-saghyz]